jgi:drug/metabolite transporter (DMT)-like permease
VNRIIAFACLALSMTLVGGYVGMSKSLVMVFPVFLLAWLRFGIGGLAMVHWLRRPANEPPMTPQVRKLLFIESFVGNFLFSICMLYGMRLTSAVAAGVIMASIPACVAVMSWLFLRERVAPRVWAAVLCAVLGIAMVSLVKNTATASPSPAPSPATDSAAWLGNLLVLGAVLCESVYAVIGKKLTGALGPRRIASLINLWGFALVTPLGVWQALQFDFGAVAPSTWLLLVFYALAASVWTVWLWMTGLTSVPAAQAGVFSVMLPISAAAVGVIVLGERMSGMQLLAFAIALLGVVLATAPERKAAA